MAINSRKVAMVGCGFVGSSSAFALMQSKLFSEMVLIDADQNRAESLVRVQQGELKSSTDRKDLCFLLGM